MAVSGNPGTYRRVNKQTGTTIDYIDIARIALPPGMRMSKNGKKYFENRANRSDRDGSL